MAWRGSRTVLARHLQATATAQPPIGSFLKARVVPHGSGHHLVAAQQVKADEVLFRWTGMLIRRNTGDRCLQVGRDAYLTPTLEEQEVEAPPWVFLNHSFQPTVRVDHAPLPPNQKGAPPPTLTAMAIRSLAAGSPLTIDYTLHEYFMYGNGFTCSESGREVRGFFFLSDEEKEAALPNVMHHVRTQHNQYLFGQESRC